MRKLFTVATPAWSRQIEAASPDAAAEAAMFEELFAAWRTRAEFRLPFTLRVVPEGASPNETRYAWAEMILAVIVIKIKASGQFHPEFVVVVESAWQALHRAIQADKNMRLLREVMLQRREQAATVGKGSQ